MTEKIAIMQDIGIGERRLRELNDEVNFLRQRKENYEKQIVRLGGEDFSKKSVLEDEGKTVKGTYGYRYYGATKDLPGIRELLAPIKRRKVRKRKVLAVENIDLAYYGIYPKEKLDLMRLEEHKASLKLQMKAMQEWSKKKGSAVVESDSDRSDPEYVLDLAKIREDGVVMESGAK